MREDITHSKPVGNLVKLELIDTNGGKWQKMELIENNLDEFSCNLSQGTLSEEKEINT